jgi:hypothetical protein
MLYWITFAVGAFAVGLPLLANYEIQLRAARQRANRDGKRRTPPRR